MTFLVIYGILIYKMKGELIVINVERDRGAWLKIPKFENIYLNDEEIEVVDEETGEMFIIDSDEFSKVYVAYGLYLMAMTPSSAITANQQIGIESFLNLMSCENLEKEQIKILKAVHNYMAENKVFEYINDTFSKVNTDNIFLNKDSYYKVIYPYELFDIFTCNRSYTFKINLLKVYICLKSHMILRVGKSDAEFVFVTTQSHKALATMSGIPVNNFRKYISTLLKDLKLIRKHSFVNKNNGTTQVIYTEYDNPNYERDFEYAKQYLQYVRLDSRKNFTIIIPVKINLITNLMKQTLSLIFFMINQPFKIFQSVRN